MTETANENRLVWRGADPDSAYVRDYLAEATAHFRECNIHFSVVVRELLASLVRCAPGDPYAKLPDEGDIHAGLSVLSPAAHELKIRVDAYWKVRNRLHANRISRLAAELGCDTEDAFRIWAARWEEDE